MTLTKTERMARNAEAVHLARSKAAKDATLEASKSITNPLVGQPDVKLETADEGDGREALAKLETQHTQACDCIHAHIHSIPYIHSHMYAYIA